MTRTTILKDLEIKAASSTPVETFTDAGKEIKLNVCLSESEEKSVETEAALAITPAGSIVIIEYQSATAAKYTAKPILFQL